MPIRKSKDVSVDLNRVGDKLYKDLKRINLKNCFLFIILYIMIYFLTVKGFGKDFTGYLFDKRLWISQLLAIGIIGLIIIRIIEIVIQKGMSVLKPDDNKFLGDIGELVVRTGEILIAMYSGYIVISLIT